MEIAIVAPSIFWMDRWQCPSLQFSIAELQFSIAEFLSADACRCLQTLAQWRFLGVTGSANPWPEILLWKIWWGWVYNAYRYRLVHNHRNVQRKGCRRKSNCVLCAELRPGGLGVEGSTPTCCCLQGNPLCAKLVINFSNPYRIHSSSIIAVRMHQNWQTLDCRGLNVKFKKNSPDRGLRSSPHLDPNLGWPWKSHYREWLIDL